MYSFSHVTIVQGGVNTRFAGLSYYKSALFSDERFIPLLVAALKEIAISGANNNYICTFYFGNAERGILRQRTC